MTSTHHAAALANAVVTAPKPLKSEPSDWRTEFDDIEREATNPRLEAPKRNADAELAQSMTKRGHSIRDESARAMVEVMGFLCDFTEQHAEISARINKLENELSQLKVAREKMQKQQIKRLIAIPISFVDGLKDKGYKRDSLEVDAAIDAKWKEGHGKRRRLG